MTKKKRELIEILLDNVKPEDWPESLPYAAQDKCDSAVYVYSGIPDITSIYNGCWHPGSLDCEFIKTVDVICKFWNKTIVHRDEFMKRWNERNRVVDSEGWIQWNGGEMPVEKGTLIDVKYRNGKINLHISAGTPLIDNGSITGKYACYWWSSESDWSIVAYRLHVTRQQKTPQQLAMSGADIESIISERGNNYGRFEDGAEIMQQLKLIAHTSQGWERMKPIQREAMDMILHKIGRILNGDPAYIENYTDIAGYAKLVIDILSFTDGATDAEVIYKTRVGGEWVNVNTRS